MKTNGSGVRDRGNPQPEPRLPDPSFRSKPGMAFWQRQGGPAILLLAAFVAIAPELVRGNSCGHDFNFHLLSWLDALNAWRHGLPYPHWTPDTNFGAGEPRFVFYSPLTWMLGAALGLVLPWAAAPVVLTFLLLAGTGLAVRALARLALPNGPATLAGCAALFSGYALFTAYERTAFAELAGGLFIPLVLLYALRECDTPSSPGCFRTFAASVAGLALAIAGSWLSNPTVGVMACYSLAAVALALALLQRSWMPALRATLGAVLGMGMVAVYLVPAAWEQRWVDIHAVTEDPGQTLENNWLFSVHADPSLALHDQVLHTASMIAVLMVAVALCGLLVALLRGRLPGPRHFWLPLALIPFAVLLLQFPFSRPVWNLLPDLRFLQFPWRWLVVLEAPMGIFAAAAVWPAKSARRWPRLAVVSASAVVFLAMTALAGTQFFQTCDDEDAVAGMLAAYRAGQGFIGTGEYEPIGADNSLIPGGLPQACLVSDPETVLGKTSEDGTLQWSASQGSCEAVYPAAANSRPENLRIVAVLPQSGYLVLRLLSFPAWKIKVNGLAAGPMPQRDDGLLTVPVPAGAVYITADFTTTEDYGIGRWLSALSVLLLTALCVMSRSISRQRLK